MDTFTDLAAGFTVALSAGNLLAGFSGVLLGTIVGVLPGLGPVSSIALLLPATFGLPPETALIMLAGVYYGTQYGGSTTAILLNLPGEASSAVTCIDGYAMTRAGRSGVALTTAAVASFVGGCAGTAAIVLVAPLLMRLALSFGPAEYVALMACGLAGAVAMSSGRFLTGAAMVALGLLVGLVGADLTIGIERFTFGIPQLSDGVNFAVVAIGLFGIAEVIEVMTHPGSLPRPAAASRERWPRRDERGSAAKATARGTLIGSLLGVLPGAGAMIASFAAYAVEKMIARTPARFGRGAIEGVAAPEAANNAAAQTSFIPLLTLGIPANGVMALMLGAMTMHRITPGPRIAETHPEAFWGVVAAMWIGNAMLLVLNLPLVSVWTRLLGVPGRVLYPVVVLMACVGVYSVGHSTFDIALTAVFGAIGFAMLRLGFDRSPFLLGFILGPLLEENFRRAMTFAGGNPLIVLTRPATVVILLLGLSVMLAASPGARAKMRARVGLH